MDNTELIRRLDRMDAKLNKIYQQRHKETWVKVGFIKMLTGWDREVMRYARDQGLIEFRTTTNGREYKVESIPEAFLLTRRPIVENSLTQQTIQHETDHASN